MAKKPPTPRKRVLIALKSLKRAFDREAIQSLDEAVKGVPEGQLTLGEEERLTRLVCNVEADDYRPSPTLFRELGELIDDFGGNVRDEAGPKKRYPPLKMPDVLILEALEAAYSSTLTQEAVEGAIPLKVRPGLRTIQNRLKYLRSKKLVHRPLGPKGGEAISDFGREVLGSRQA